MTTILPMTGLTADDPLAFLAALGVLRVVARHDRSAALSWARDGAWRARLRTTVEDVPALLAEDAQRWVDHPALAFAVDADRKIQDLKHPPEVFRAQLREAIGRLTDDREEVDFLAAYATGVAVDGSGQTKPTALHFAAGQQRFLDVALADLPLVSTDGLRATLTGDGLTAKAAKSFRWRAAAARERAYLHVDPSKVSEDQDPDREWLAFQGLPMLPSAPEGKRIVTACFEGRGKDFRMTWPVWGSWLTEAAVRGLLVRGGAWDGLEAGRRAALGVVEVLRAQVERSDQGYGSFAAAVPV